uniref:Prolactin n=1 Tax=Pelusios castaneus TaxID=367368 RepID=A0A8C8RWD1_9SAUR
GPCSRPSVRAQPGLVRGLSGSTSCLLRCFPLTEPHRLGFYTAPSCLGPALPLPGLQVCSTEKLTHLILRLLQAWKEPLSHLDQNIGHHQELSSDSLSKAKQISNMVHELKTGVEKVTEKMQSMGIISNLLNGMGSSEAAGLSISNEGNLMSHYEFIHCFRRDSNKVQSYLKILKCRILPENSC